MSREWTEKAEEFDLEVRGGLGGAAAGLFAAAWRAGVDDDALGALAGTVVALGQRPSVLQPRERGEILPSDREMRERAEDIEGDARDLLKTGRQMHSDCMADWERAARDLRKADAELKAAKDDKAQNAARAAARAASSQMADCEVALEILGEAGARLHYALGCVIRVPDDLATTYEAAYRLKRHNIRLPADGDFLSGTSATPVHPAHAMSG